MKKLAFITLAFITLVGCGKDRTVHEHPILPQVPEKKLIEYQNLSNPSDKMVYSYNESGKLQKVISGTHTWTITYGISNLTITSTYNSNGAVLSTSNYEHDESGKTVSMTAKNGSGVIRFIIHNAVNLICFMYRVTI